jgi:hypothetical protein
LGLSDTLGNISAPISSSSLSYSAGKKVLQVLIMDLSSCGASGAPSITESQVLNVFSESANPTAQTFGQHIRSCSPGKLNVEIRVAKVKMPCSSSGTLSGFPGSYTWNVCPDLFYYTIFKAIEIAGANGI